VDANPVLSAVAGLLTSIIKQMQGIFNNHEVPGTIIFLLTVIKGMMDK